jgi:hypothetical protein
VFWEVLAPDHARLIGNAVRWALGRTQEVIVEGPGVLDLALRRGPDGLALALFNLTNPMMMKGPARENFPAGPQRISVALPPGRVVGAARAVVADAPLSCTCRDGRAELKLPGLERLEVVHLTWE